MIKAWLDRSSRRLPAELAAELELAPRERVLRWATVDSGSRLVATVHGLWEHREGSAAERLCWRDVLAFHIDTDGAFSVSRTATPSDHLHVGAGNDLPWVVQSMMNTSRLVEQHFLLPSGSRLLISARDCPYERVISWTSALTPAPGSDPRRDTELARRALDRARAEYGSTEPIGGSALSKPVPVPGT